MKKRGLLLAVSLAALAASGCGQQPGAGSLRDSFSEQISAIDLVHDFQRDGDELTFLRPDGSGEEVSWRVRIDSAVVEPHDDEAMPYRGIVESSWWVNGRLVLPSGNISNLPLWILDEGLSQDGWAFWEASTARWSWK